MRKRSIQRVKGTICTEWSPEYWEFRLASGKRWDYVRPDHHLSCGGERVAEGIMCLGDAVLFAQGYETGVADLLRLAASKMSQARAAIGDDMSRGQFIAWLAGEGV